MFSPAKKSSRLDRWTGRLRGAQGEDSLFAWLKDRTVRPGLFLVFALLAVVVVLYVVRFQPALGESRTHILTISLLVLGTLAAGLLLSGPPWRADFTPLTVAALILSIAYTPQFALLMCFC